jgi:type I restriction enzyme S subunit
MTWPVVPLAEVAEVRLGRQRSPKNHQGDSMRPYIRAANVTWSGLDLSDVKMMNFTDDEMATYRMAPGDIVLSEASGSPGEVGKPALWSGEIAECAFQNTLIRVRPWKHEPVFLMHYFRFLALDGQFVEHSRGVGIHHIGRARLASWPTPLPPPDEQRRIVDLLEDHLSRLDAAHQSIRRSLSRLSALRDAALSEAVEVASASSGAEVKAVSDLARVSSGLTPLKGNKAFYEGGTIPWITSGDLHQGLITEAKHFVTEAALDETTLKLVPAGAILIAMYGEGKTRGTAAELGIDATTNQACAAVVLHDPELRPWVRLVLDANYSKLRRLAVGGVQPNLNQTMVKAIEIPIPVPGVRSDLLAHRAELDDARGRLHAELDAARLRGARLRRSFLAAAFSGRLVSTPESLLEAVS